MKPTIITASLALALLSTPALAAGGGLGGPLTYGCDPDPRTGVISQKTCADWYGALMLREDKRRLQNALAVFSAPDPVAAVKYLTYPELQVLIVAMGSGLGGQRGISGNRTGIGRGLGDIAHDIFSNPRDLMHAIGVGFGDMPDLSPSGGNGTPQGGGPGGGSYGGAPGNGFGNGSAGTMGGGSQNPGADY